MKIENGNIVNTLQAFFKTNSTVEVDENEISAALRNLDFSKTLALIEKLKADDAMGVAEILGLSVSDPIEEDGYGTLGTQQPSSSSIKAQNTAINTSTRRANNTQQDANRDAAVPQRTVAGGNKVPTGAPNRVNTIADPDDQERAQNAQVASQAANQASVNAQEIERLKQLAFGRR